MFSYEEIPEHCSHCTVVESTKDTKVRNKSEDTQTLQLRLQKSHKHKHFHRSSMSFSTAVVLFDISTQRSSPANRPLPTHGDTKTINAAQSLQEPCYSRAGVLKHAYTCARDRITNQPKTPRPTRPSRLGTIRMHFVQRFIMLNAVSPDHQQIMSRTKPDTCTSPAC